MKEEKLKYLEELRISHIINDVITKYIDYKRNCTQITPNFIVDGSIFNGFQIPESYIIEHQEIDNLLVLIVPISLSKEQIGEITTILHNHYYIKVRQEHSLDKDIKFNILAFKKKVN